MKKIENIIIFFCIIILLISISYINNNKTILNLNENNRHLINELDVYIKQTENINKVGHGFELGDEYIYIYHTFGKTEKIPIYEGEMKKANFAKEIDNNGYKEKKRWKLLDIISAIVLVIMILSKIYHK